MDSTAGDSRHAVGVLRCSRVVSASHRSVADVPRSGPPRSLDRGMLPTSDADPFAAIDWQRMASHRAPVAG